MADQAVLRAMDHAGMTLHPSALLELDEEDLLPCLEGLRLVDPDGGLFRDRPQCDGRAGCRQSN